MTSPGGPKFFTRGNIAFVGLSVLGAISVGFTESYLKVYSRGQNAVVPGGNSWRASGTSFHESGQLLPTSLLNWAFDRLKTWKLKKAMGHKLLCEPIALIGVFPLYCLYSLYWLFLQFVLFIPFTYMDPSVVIGYHPIIPIFVTWPFPFI